MRISHLPNDTSLPQVRPNLDNRPFPHLRSLHYSRRLDGDVPAQHRAFAPRRVPHAARSGRHAAASAVVHGFGHADADLCALPEDHAFAEDDGRKRAADLRVGVEHDVRADGYGLRACEAGVLGDEARGVREEGGVLGEDRGALVHGGGAAAGVGAGGRGRGHGGGWMAIVEELYVSWTWN